MLTVHAKEHVSNITIYCQKIFELSCQIGDMKLICGENGTSITICQIDHL